MSRPFKVGSAEATFGNFGISQNSGNYIANKNIRNSFCNPNMCVKKPKFSSQSQMIAWRNANNLAKKELLNSFNKTNLNINLITKLNLEDVCVIKNNETNDCKTSIVNSDEIYTKYNIDPDGRLFGDNRCNINNFTNYLEYNKPKYN